MLLPSSGKILNQKFDLPIDFVGDPEGVKPSIQRCFPKATNCFWVQTRTEWTLQNHEVNFSCFSMANTGAVYSEPIKLESKRPKTSAWPPEKKSHEN